MRIKVDAEKCQGHNRCFSLAVELFDVDDYGYATEIDDGAVSYTHLTLPTIYSV